MKFSIITPVLDGARFLPELIASLEQQTHAGWEHIIVDGGSKDGSLDIARDLAARDERARLIEAPGLGLYPSIFRGFDAARGDWLAWLNSDDLYTRWAFAAVAEHVSRTGANWVTGFPGAWDRDGVLRYVRPYGSYPRDWIRRGWFHNGFLGHLQQESMFFSRTLMAALGADRRDAVESMKLAGDFLLWRELAAYAPLSVIPTALAGFRFHGANLSTARMDAYTAEVKSTGAPFPNGHIARLSARLFRAYATRAALPAMHRADAALHASLERNANRS